MIKLKPYLKAAASALVCAAAYLVGVVPAEGGVQDVSQLQWLGLVVFMGGAYGIVFHLPYVSTKAAPARDEAGSADGLVAVAILVGVVLLLFGVRFR